MYSSSNDFELIADCVSGNEEAWNAFVDRFSKLVYYAINKTLHFYAYKIDQDEIEDIYSSVFLSFLNNGCRKLKQYEGKRGCTLSSWIRLITIRKTIDYLRKQREHSSIDKEGLFSHPMKMFLKDEGKSPEERILALEKERLMKESIEKLPVQDRLFMELYYGRELSPKEIADILNITISTVYSKKNRIREKLEIILMEKGLNA